MDFKRLASATLSIVVALVLIIIIISNPNQALNKNLENYAYYAAF